MEKKIIILLFCCLLHFVSAQLRVAFYSSTCPRAETIIRQLVENRFGADRSITYIITVATRDAVVLAGGPRYNVPTGRRAVFVSDSAEVNLPGPSLSVQEAFPFFRAKGLTLNDMVTLLGAHTVGVAHCGFFQDRLSNFQGTGKPDPTLDSTLASRLLRTSGTTSRPLNRDPTVFLDQNTSFIFDHQFYNQIRSKKGILQIDQQLALDRSTAPIVSSFASNPSAFQQNFANAMIKLANIQVLVGKAGEIRKNCRVFNPKSRKGF
ncbi:unnamed protein product [Fraxinus pennsylvanica]|uniref:peroxidase n=1 Tax=Fraxinus pennsylvanica TaxID=56036 RepID=A0AAD2E9K8_9LAMI|nr:unnamed protein product [Fraxinus pennsylvanica]